MARERMPAVGRADRSKVLILVTLKKLSLVGVFAKKKRWARITPATLNHTQGLRTKSRRKKNRSVTNEEAPRHHAGINRGARNGSAVARLRSEMTLLFDWFVATICWCLLYRVVPRPVIRALFLQRPCWAPHPTFCWTWAWGEAAGNLAF